MDPLKKLKNYYINLVCEIFKSYQLYKLLKKTGEYRFQQMLCCFIVLPKPIRYLPVIEPGPQFIYQKIHIDPKAAKKNGSDFYIIYNNFNQLILV